MAHHNDSSDNLGALMTEFAYDQVQYQSHPYRQSHPERLYTTAKLFGLNPVDYTRARILELGCASGGNIIPIAYNYPACDITGIDLSEKQIESGNDFIKKLNLNNIKLYPLSILDFNNTNFTQFDYIICHGIYSWVPGDVREKIFSILQNHLSPEGIAYISYNAYPGWNSVHSMRDMMLYHSRKAQNPHEKAAQSRALLQWLADGLKDEKTAYSEFLQHEVDLLRKQPDSYLLHDHLEEVNFPTYFHRFMEQATQYGLDYLADAKLSAMFIANLPEKAATVLSEMTNIVRSNQYMDFIRNQRFRATILCLNTAKINRQITTEQVETFYISYMGGALTAPVSEVDLLTEGTPLVFSGAGINLTVRHPISKVAMCLLESKKHFPMVYDDFVLKLKEKLETYQLFYDVDYLKNHLKEDLNLMRLVFGGIIELSSEPALYTLDYSDTPNTTELIKQQLKTGVLVSSQRHELVKLNTIEKIFLETIDGYRSQEEIINIIINKINANEIDLTNEPEFQDFQNLTQDQRILKLNMLYPNIFQKLANSALLIS